MCKEFERHLKELKTALTAIGIKKGDIVYIASDITNELCNLKVKYGISGVEERNRYLNDIINVFQEVVGENGTLLFPTFSWSFCRGKGFDYYKTLGEVGALSNFVLKKRKDFLRTQHPMYSFMVWGKYKDLLVNMNNQDGWSDASPFYFFRMYSAKQLLFNIEAYQGLTFGHYVEQCAHVPYRHTKYFFGKYKDAKGYVETRMYSMCVRDLDVQQYCNIHNAYLIANNVASQTEWDNNKLTAVDLAASFPILLNDMKENHGINTLRFDDYRLDWSKKQTIPYELGKIPE